MPVRPRALRTPRTHMRRFLLMRHEDHSGVSGTGAVAEGIVFSTGKAVLCWQTQFRSVGVYDSLDELVAIHGHGTSTEVVFLDAVPARSRR